MFGTISIKLKEVTIKGYFPPPLILDDPLIFGGAGILTISFRPLPSYSPTGPMPGLPVEEFLATGSSSSMACRRPRVSVEK
jgi:hypothetical protein